MQTISEYANKAQEADMDWFPVSTEDLETWQAEVERLQAIVDKLPVDANGEPVVPRIQDLWHPDEPYSGTLLNADRVEFYRTSTVGQHWYYHKVGECYSTREAAEAADGG